MIASCSSEGVERDASDDDAESSPDVPETSETADRVLSAALRPGSGEVIDCAGGVLRPVEPWSEPDASDLTSEITVQVGVLLHDVHDVAIRNCRIEGFQLGILVVGGGGHEISGNEIEAPSDGIEIVDATDVLVSDNTIRFARSGLEVTRRAHRTHISANRLVGLPESGRAVIVLDPPVAVMYYLVDGELIQVPNRVGSIDDVVIEDNELVVGETDKALYVAVRSRTTTVRNNSIGGARTAVWAPGFPDGTRVPLPGRCADDEERYCDLEFGCFIAGVDAASLGPCVFDGDLSCWRGGSPCATEADCVGGSGPCNHFVEDSTMVQALRVAGNTITEACAGVSLLHTIDAVIEDNHMTGRADRGRCGSTVGHGILLSTDAMASATVGGNVVSGFESGLRLELTERFASRIWRNELAGNEAPWRTDAGVALDETTIELSVDGEGNYWGLGCDEGRQGFPELSFCTGPVDGGELCADDRDCERGSCRTPPVVDSHAFGAPLTEGSRPCR